ncbi:S-layer homology domain-containing protein [Cohnella ginsengisoli]|uniref:S-layer homology domain-containing protein n=1 Tax=Cohnella ginsengisoli TaxID=425004 RepID=A0A9X4KST6_9BACL|nr:S-layer homology domain-containing protein [Cohnella ginsengisoli]MDG0794910.1 S-layer homology domain-containing protein [Cohnella ginsengisoli]
MLGFKRFKSLASLALSVSLAVAGLSAALPAGKSYAEGASAATVAAAASVNVQADIQAAIGYVNANGGVSSDWLAFSFARAGQAVSADYKTKLAAGVETEWAKASPDPTALARFALVANAVGLDARSIGGRDLIAKLASYPSFANVYADIFVLLALDSGNYELPAGTAWTRGDLVAAIVSGIDGSTVPDLYGMALSALGKYKERPEVAAAADKAVAWLSANLADDNSEAIAQTIVGLAAYGIDPADAKFAKGGSNLIQRLLAFKNTDGGFKHQLSDAASDKAFATEQALRALAAYGLFGTSHRSVYVNAASQWVATGVAIEGLNGPLAALSATQAVYAWDALVEIADRNKLKLGYTDDPQYGKFLSAIGDAKGDQSVYWLYAVKRGGAYAPIDASLEKFRLQAGDELYLYLSGADSGLVKSVTAKAAAGGATAVNVQYTYYDSSFKEVTGPAAGVQVAIGGQTATTDASGTATFKGLSAGELAYTVTGYRAGAAPRVLKYSGTVAVGAGQADGESFADAADISSWASEAVNEAYAAGWLQGISTTELKFAPKQQLTRVQFAALILRLLGETPASGAKQTFADVAPGVWYFDAVMTAKSKGLIGGVTTTSFKPNDAISRQDLAVVLARAFKLDGSGSKTAFSDQGQISGYALASVRAVYDKGLLKGTSGTAFDPKAKVTREMAAVIASNLLKQGLISK